MLCRSCLIVLSSRLQADRRNSSTLYSFGQSEGWTTDISTYFGGSLIKAGIIITMLFTLVIWVGSALLLLVAAFMCESARRRSVIGETLEADEYAL